MASWDRSAPSARVSPRCDVASARIPSWPSRAASQRVSITSPPAIEQKSAKHHDLPRTLVFLAGVCAAFVGAGGGLVRAGLADPRCGTASPVVSMSRASSDIFSWWQARDAVWVPRRAAAARPRGARRARDGNSAATGEGRGTPAKTRATASPPKKKSLDGDRPVSTSATEPRSSPRTLP